MPQISKPQQGSQRKKHSGLTEQIVDGVRLGLFLASGLLFAVEIVLGILGSPISLSWWSLTLVFGALFVGLSYSGIGKKVRKWSKIIVLIGFLLVFPLFTANLMGTYQSASQILSTPKEIEYFRSVLGRSYNYTELYQWENNSPMEQLS